MIQAVVIVKGAAVVDVFMQDDNDDIYIVDMDVLAIGMCPICNEGLDFTKVCPDCGHNWNNDEDTSDIANELLQEEAKSMLALFQDEQFVEGGA
jgi:hypothetical protein